MSSSDGKSSDPKSSGGGSSWRGRDRAVSATAGSLAPTGPGLADPDRPGPAPAPRPAPAPSPAPTAGSAPVTPLTVTFSPNPALSTRLRSASHPLVVKPFRSPSRAKPRVSIPSSSDSTLALLSRIQATRRSRLTASRTASQFWRSESAEAGPAETGPAEPGPGAADGRTAAAADGTPAGAAGAARARGGAAPLGGSALGGSAAF